MFFNNKDNKNNKDKDNYNNSNNVVNVNVIENDTVYLDFKNRFEKHSTKDIHLISEAAELGRLDIVKYLHSSGCQSNTWVFRAAARNGDLQMLEYLFQNNFVHDDYAISNAAGKGRLDIIEYLLSKGCNWNTETLCQAAEKGHLNIIVYCLEKGCPYNLFVAHAAARGGYLDILKYCVENGYYKEKHYYRNYRLLEDAIHYNHLHIIKYLFEIQHLDYSNFNTDFNLINSAAHYGHLNIIKYLCSKGFTINEDTVESAITGFRNEDENLDSIKYLIEVGCNFIISFKRIKIFAYIAAIDNDFILVKYLCSSVMSKNKYTLSLKSCKKLLHISAKNGNFEMFTFFYSFIQFLFSSTNIINYHTLLCTIFDHTIYSKKVPFRTTINLNTEGRIKIFKFCFQRWPDPENFLKTVFKYKKYKQFIEDVFVVCIDEIWRELLTIDLNKYSKRLEQKLIEKRKELDKIKEKLIDVLNKKVAVDIIKYVVGIYI